MKRRDFLVSSVGAVGAAVSGLVHAASKPCPPNQLSAVGGTQIRSECGSATDGVFEPALVGEAQVEQYLVNDAVSGGLGGPNFEFWNRRLRLRWRNPTVGDYTGHDGSPGAYPPGNDVSQGGAPFARGTFPRVGEYNDIDVRALVERTVRTGKNKGWYLVASTTGSTTPNARCEGRTAQHPPQLEVVTSTGTYLCRCTANANWFVKSANALPVDSRAEFQVGTSRRVHIRFDLSGVKGEVARATMRLYVVERFGSTSTSYIDVFEMDPPTFQLGAGEASPQLGLAAKAGEAALQSHPDVLMAGHFAGTLIGPESSTTRRTTSPSMPGARIAYQHAVSIVEDPDAPGTSYWRGECVNVLPGSAKRDPFELYRRVMFADPNDMRRDPARPDIEPPLYPVDRTTLLEEAYFRLYLMLEDDWLDTQEGAKFGITWDLRLGTWDEVAGWWNNQGGNSNTVSDGLRHLGQCHSPLGSSVLGGSDYTKHPDFKKYAYKGHMQRMEPTLSGRDGDPYQDVYGLLGYNYNNDMTDTFAPNGGAWFSYSNVVPALLKKGRWYCIEQYLRMNSLNFDKKVYATPPDTPLDPAKWFGNYEANPDGVLKTWLNGVLIDEISSLRWRCHPDMGIGQAGSVWYIGGNGTTNWPAPMHFRINHVVFARQYIGPRTKR